MVKKSTDGKCRFYEKKHSYRVGQEEYKSVTTLIGEHFPKFDVKKMARMLASFGWAKRQKKGVRYWIAEWKQSALTGTLIHEELEKLINNPEEYTTLKDVLHPRTTVAWEGFHQLTRGMGEPVVTPELLIYDEEYKIAGQIDCLIEVNSDEGNGREITLLDWKATKDISFKYKYNTPEEATGSTMETMHLQNCNGIKYSLQLSLYAYLLERQGWVIKDLYIGHICPKKNKFVPIKVEYMKNDIIRILDERKIFLEDIKNE